MNFFEHQDQARQNTTKLLLLFVLAIAGIIITLYLSIALVLLLTSKGRFYLGWSPGLFLFIATLALLVIGCGSLYKWIRLQQGGHIVAIDLGGRFVDTQSTIPEEQMLLNVVAEVAIASGASIPDVFLLDAESGINAFAAGLTPETSVIGITRGCLEQLDRDELQGVIAHEFSHILNGDMKLNVQLMGILHGILFLSILGRIFLHAAGRGAYYRSSGKSAIFWAGIGIAFMSVGGIGLLCGRLIKSSISRQREFLADASAVQFTRNADGLAGALNKIYNASFKSYISSPRAEEASHLFFGNAILSQSFSSGDWLATHPPIKVRLRRIGRSVVPRQRTAGSSQSPSQAAVASEAMMGFQAAAYAQEEQPLKRSQSVASSNQVKPEAQVVQPIQLLAGIGSVSQQQIEFARSILKSLPVELQQATVTVTGGTAIIFSLLLNPEPEIKSQQIEQLGQVLSPECLNAIAQTSECLNQCDPRCRLPLIDLVISAFRKQSVTEIKQFLQQVREFIAENEPDSLRNYTFQLILEQRLVPYLSEASQTPTTEFTTPEQVWPDCVVVLSALALSGQNHPDNQLYVLREGLSRLKVSQRTLPNEMGVLELRKLGESLGRLKQANPKLKQKIVNACTQTALVDGTITLEESDLLRAIVIALGCPMPPVLNTLGSTSRKSASRSRAA